MVLGRLLQSVVRSVAMIWRDCQTRGQCPECGFEYDPDSLIVLYGWNGLGPGQSSPSMASGVCFDRAVWRAVWCPRRDIRYPGKGGWREGVGGQVTAYGQRHACVADQEVPASTDRLRSRCVEVPGRGGLVEAGTTSPDPCRVRPACRLRAMPPDPFWSSRTFLYISQVEGNAYKDSGSVPRPKRKWLRMTGRRWILVPIQRTNRRILETRCAVAAGRLCRRQRAQRPNANACLHASSEGAGALDEQGSFASKLGCPIGKPQAVCASGGIGRTRWI